MEKVISIFKKYGLQDYAWIDPKKIVVAQWVRMKCQFGCDGYGGIACPPNLPSVEECKIFFREYTRAVLLHFKHKFKDPNDRIEWARQINLRLLDAEREVFLEGFYKAFLLLMSTCNLCEACSKDRLQCKNPLLRRPTPEGMAVDVYSTVRQYGFPIKVIKDRSEKINRYALLMIK